jgi:glycosyltransferase involved in cell wall biosynthesis
MSYSCIIACFNGENYLREAIGSVIQQLTMNDELIVVNDGSKDDTQNIINSYNDPRIKPIHLIKNIGFSAARNEGLKLASKEYICFLDHDDLWPEDRQDLINNGLHKNPDAELIGGLMKNFFSPEIEHLLIKKYKLPPEMSSCFSSAMVLKRSLIEKAGLFDPAIKKGDWIDFMSRINLLKPKKIMLDKILVLRRIHDKNNSHADTNMASYLPALKKHILRHK